LKATGAPRFTALPAGPSGSAAINVELAARHARADNTAIPAVWRYFRMSNEAF
jgi:hypothetical protein